MIPLKLRPLSDPWSESINQESIGPFRLSCRLGMVRSSPMMHNLHRRQKCIEFSHEMGPIIRCHGHRNPKSEDHLLSQEFGTFQCSCSGCSPGLSPLCQCISASDNARFSDDVMGKSMIQSRYKRSNGSTTHVGRSSFDFGHLLHC